MLLVKDVRVDWYIHKIRNVMTELNTGRSRIIFETLLLLFLLLLFVYAVPG